MIGNNFFWIRPLFHLLCLSVFMPLVAAAGSADLVTTSVSASPGIIAPGDQVVVTGRVENRGNGGAGYFRTGMYLSTDPVIAKDDIHIGSPKGVETPSLGPGVAEPFVYRTNLISAAAGVYYIGAVADERNSVSESNEGNNGRAGNRVLIARSESVASGNDHSLMLKEDGSLWAWGSNAHGQLGDGGRADKTAPARIGKDKRWVAISAGGYHSLALKSDGSLWAWGNNACGQVGDGTTTDKTAPVRIGKDKKWVAISAGGYHSLALKSDGTLWAWGHNAYGQVGDGTGIDKSAPVRIGTASAWVRISAGAFHSAAVSNDLALWTWGLNRDGRLGDGTTADRSAPVRIGADNRWVAVSAGEDHTLALNLCATCWSTYSLWSWGGNKQGQLGDGTTVDKTVPVRIGTDSPWTKVSAGKRYSLALQKDGTLWGWGFGTGGRKGDAATSVTTAPAQIGMGAAWTSISTGALHHLARQSDGTAWSWGGSGDAAAPDNSGPVQITKW